jgi:hypothetical protein
MKTCRYCRAKIFDNASICQYCGAYQNRFRQNLANFGYISALFVALVAIAQVILASRQLDEARQARIETSKTLKEAQQAAEYVNEVKKRVDLQSVAIDQIAQQAQNANEIIQILEHEFYRINEFDFIHYMIVAAGNSLKTIKIDRTNSDRFIINSLEKNLVAIMHVDFFRIGLSNKDKSILFKSSTIYGDFELYKYPIMAGILIDDLSNADILDIYFVVYLYDKNLYKDSEIYKKYIKDNIKNIRVVVTINNRFFVGHDIPTDQFECNLTDREPLFIGCYVRFDVSKTYQDKEILRSIYKQQQTFRRAEE